MTHYSTGWTKEKERQCKKLWREKNPEKGAEYQARYRALHPERAKKWDLENKEKFSAYHKKYGMNNPEKIRAKNIIENEIAHKRITKPIFCVNCGNQSANLHGHHPDYSKPKEVIWLCSLCHSALHKIQRNHKQVSREFVEKWIKHISVLPNADGYFNVFEPRQSIQTMLRELGHAVEEVKEEGKDDRK